MGETAEVLARQYGITREASDAFALESQQQGRGGASTAGRFARRDRAGHGHRREGQATVDRRPTSIRAPARRSRRCASCRWRSRRSKGTPGIITAGLVVGHHRRRRRGGAGVGATARAARGLTPLASIIGWASAGVDPRIMGIGPVPAIAEAAANAPASTIDDFDLVELNEAFAAQVLAVLKDVPIPAEKLNVNGGAIALGHPIGCTGARIVVTLLHEMQRRGARRGLATLCVSGGMGMAMAIESLDSSTLPSGAQVRMSCECMHIAVIPGDGIGKDVTAEAVKVLDARRRGLRPRASSSSTLPWSADHYLETGETMPPNGYDAAARRSTRSSSARSAIRACPTTATRATSCSARASSSISTSTTGR